MPIFINAYKKPFIVDLYKIKRYHLHFYFMHKLFKYTKQFATVYMNYKLLFIFKMYITK